jgi:hypothetical protein
MPAVKGKGGGSHPGNPNGKRGKRPPPVPERITEIVLKFPHVLPCSIRNFDKPGGICGKPATVCHVWQHTALGQWATPGLWVCQPVCRECAAAAAKVYE